jgi:hypothetical protein
MSQAAGSVVEVSEGSEPDGAVPRDVYTRRLELARVEIQRVEAASDRIANARLAAGVAALVLAVLAIRSGHTAYAWAAAAAAAVFVALVAWSTRLAARLDRARGAADFYEHGLDRVEGRWAGRGEAGTRFLDPEHPYAADLDLFGAGSIFERLCTAHTGAGQATLAAWLNAPAPPPEIAARHDAIVELRPRLELREDLARLATGLREGIDPASLVAWGQAPPILTTSPAARWGLAALSALALASLALWSLTDIGAAPFALCAIVLIAVAQWYSTRVHQALEGLESHARDLDILAFLLERIEREPFASPRLVQVRERLMATSDGSGPPSGPDDPPSRRIARLARMLDRLEYRHNLLFAPLAALLFWGTQHAMSVEAWRRRSGRAIAGWLDAIGDFEALASLASYAFENPADPFATLVPEANGPLFDAHALGHPLLDPAVCVRNNLRLDTSLRLDMVTGSNMSGKSTLLRSVGVAAVMAQAGAPVRAGSLTMSPLMPGGTIRVQDSLQAGRSRFYAEILRLRQLVDLAAKTPPLLFLIDEILHGTNSHDRREGGGAILRGLLDRGAIGLVSTHDLSLAAIADALAPRAKNIHFADDLKNGKLAFDYQIRPGVVERSNALELMRAVGLDV